VRLDTDALDARAFSLQHDRAGSDEWVKNMVRTACGGFADYLARPLGGEPC
jgi:hypothetical protein